MTRLKRVTPVLLLCVALLIVVLTACNPTFRKSFTFHIDNGEQIKVTLDTAGGYDLQQENGRISVEKDGETILVGKFLTSAGFDQYVDQVLPAGNVTVLEEKPDYYLYQLEGEAGMETTFLLKVDGAETGVLLVTLSPLEQARAVYEQLKFEKVE